MWIVRLALRRPYTFVVLALLMIVAGVQVLRRSAATDIFPVSTSPSSAWCGPTRACPAAAIEQQITQFSEYSLAGNVGDIKNVESQSFDGSLRLIRLTLHSRGGRALRHGPERLRPRRRSCGACRRAPSRRSSCGTVRQSVAHPQIAFRSDTLSESEIFDHVNQRVRTALSVVQGTRLPAPPVDGLGGRSRWTSTWPRSAPTAPLAVRRRAWRSRRRT